MRPVLSLLLAAALGAHLSAQQWPSFRGANAAGIADGQNAPLVWDAGLSRNVAWKTPIPGLGHSSPVVWGNRVFITAAVTSRADPVFRRDVTGREGALINIDPSGDRSPHIWRLYSLDKRTGRILWETTAHQGVPKVDRHLRNTHATATPATDGEFVVAFFGSEGLFSYHMDGRLAWKRDLGVLDAGSIDDPDFQWGTASSPIIYRGLVIVQCDVQDGSFLAAFDLASGREVWRTRRDEFSSWSTPVIHDLGAQAEVVTNATRFARGYDALTGKELWRLGGNSENAIPTPVVTRELIIVTSGYRPVQPIYAIRPGARGDITPGKEGAGHASIAWSHRQGGPYIPTPIAYGAHLYVLANNGVLTVYETGTGKRVYQRRLADRGGSYSASPVAADGRLYFASEDGDVLVVRAGPEYELLATNPVGDVIMATPAISEGLMLVRTLHHVIAFGTPSDAKQQPRESPAGDAVERQWVTVPPQTCQVGCVPQDSECSDNERPRHPVRIPREFMLMATEVTVSSFRSYAAETKATMPEQPEWSGDDHPVVNVSWGEAEAYCRVSGARLPTEAEWECAARGGVDGRIYPWGDRYQTGLANDSDAFKQAGTRKVASYPPNAYGVYDMVGNAWEWVNDWFAEDYYGRSPSENPPGPTAGTSRGMRGGSWRPYPRVFRVSNRGRGQPDRASYYVRVSLRS